MKIMITGSNGQLGHELLRLAPKNAIINAVDIDTLDITDQSAVDYVVSQVKPQLIINAAAYTAVDRAESDPGTAYAVNRDAVKFLAEAAVKNDASIIHISTDYVFDGKASVPYRPDSPTLPVSVYGKSKLAGEEELLQIIPDRAVIIRTAWLYSPYGANFMKTMLRLMKERSELGVVADQLGTPTSAATLAAAVWQFAERPDIHGTFHWTDNGSASWYDFAVAIRMTATECGLLDTNAAQLKPITTADYPTPAPRPAYSILDKNSTFEVLGLNGTRWQDSLKEVILRIL